MYGPYLAYGDQTTYSRGNPWPSSGGSVPGNVGGPFLTIRKWYSDSNTVVDAFKSPFRYVGPQFAKYDSLPAASSSYPSLTPATDATLAAWGTTAIARCLPTNPVSDLAQFVGELRADGIPHIIGSSAFRERARTLKELPGDEYLNVEFGWKPFVSDIRKFAYAVQNSHYILEKFRQGSGQLMHRSYEWPEELSTVTVDEGMRIPPPALPTSLYENYQWSGQRYKVTSTYRKKWFEGAFMYHLAVGNSQTAKMARFAAEAKKLLGVRIDPDLVWNLTPWSWAVDWIGNFGDIVHNASAFSEDSLVMKYGYLMYHQKVTDTYTHSGTVYAGGARPTMTQTLGVEIKQRLPATPYGFGLTVDSFSERQWAILAALGLSRGSHKLA